MLRFEIGVPVNYEEAIKYAKIAIEKGQPEVMLLYAIMLEKGEGIPANKEESNKYYKMAIEHDNVSAMLIYGSKLERETGNSII